MTAIRRFRTLADTMSLSKFSDSYSAGWIFTVVGVGVFGTFFDIVAAEEWYSSFRFDMLDATSYRGT